MAAFNFAPLYRLRNSTFWPSLTPCQPIPPTLASIRAGQHGSSVGMGMVKAVTTVLTDGRCPGLGFDPAANRWSLSTESGSAPGTFHLLGGDTTTLWIDHPGYLLGIASLVDALTVLRAEAISDEFRARWWALLRVLTAELGCPPPYPAPQLLHAARSRPGGQPSPATEAMMAVTDALYFCAKERHATTLVRVEARPDPAPLVLEAGARDSWLYGLPLVASSTAVAVAPVPSPVDDASKAQTDASEESGAGPKPVVDRGPLATLRRLIRRGGTALLVGPTGVGKSKCARLAAQAEGVAWVRLEGRPGLTDRELFGKVAPVVDVTGAQHYAWVDGPLAQAWRLAQAGIHVVLLIDELARFDPYNLAPLVGALDTVRGNEALTLAGLSEAVRATLRPDEAYRTLELPTGERLLASTTALTVIATTNLGADYLQLQQEFDAALLRRFVLQLDVTRLEGAERRRILAQEGHVPEAIAEVFVALEDYALLQTGSHGGLLRRELNLGTCLAWAEETRCLHEEGLDWSEAMVAAAEITAIPYVCARDTAGYVEAPAADSLRDVLRRVLDAIHLPSA